jgi:hypothetical protein
MSEGQLREELQRRAAPENLVAHVDKQEEDCTYATYVELFAVARESVGRPMDGWMCLGMRSGWHGMAPLNPYVFALAVQTFSKSPSE